MNGIWVLVKKDFSVDFRQKYPIAGIGLYIFSTIYISYLAFNAVITPTTWNALFWTLLLFTSITGLTKGFTQENDRVGYYYFLTSPIRIISAKLLYHLIYEGAVIMTSLLLFMLFLPIDIPTFNLFIINLILGGVGLASAFTLISALASKSDNASTMMAVLSFPVIIPVLLLCVTTSRSVILGANLEAISGNLTTLLSVNVIIIALTFILFPYSWRN